jgi:3-hydroxyphenylacetate 6-hydroxylase
MELPSVPHALGLVSILALTYLIFNEFERYRARIKGLSGPPSWPVIGNIWEIRQSAAQKYVEWSKQYGDVYQVQLGNTPVVVVNSAAAAKELWVHNSQALASRPQTYSYHKLASGSQGFTIGTSPYDESLKRKKKGAAVALNRPAIQSYVPFLDIESRDFIRDIWTYGDMGKTPVDPLPLIQRLAMSLAATINWGVRIPTIQDPLFQEIIEVEEVLNRVRSTTGNLKDFIPLLRWNPFAKTSTEVRDMRIRRDKYIDQLNADLQVKIEAGTNAPCIQANIITYKDEPLSDQELTSISLSMLSGGFETVSSTLQFTIGWLSQNPDVQDKAFREASQYQAGFPDAADDMGCAYIAGLVKEALRYFSVLPLVLPRQSIKDVVHEGVVIPKDTTFYMNAFSCNRDPLVWDDPDVFRPERWIEQPGATLFTFGLGYRMCSAHMLAQRELYLVLMRLVASYCIEAVGKIDCDPVTGMLNPRDLIIQPHRYKVKFVARNDKVFEFANSLESLTV